MEAEVINVGSIDQDTFKGFIRLIGIEFENWKEDQNEEKKEIGSSQYLL